MTWDEALSHSLEWLELVAAAQERERARHLLELGQTLSLGFGGGDKWLAWQKKLMERTQVKS